MKHAYAGSQETVIGQDGIDTNIGTETIVSADGITKMAPSEGTGIA